MRWLAAATPAILARLADLLADRDRNVRETAGWAVAALGAAAATPAILVRLAESWQTRTGVCGRQQRGPWLRSVPRPPRRRSWPAWPTAWPTRT